MPTKPGPFLPLPVWQCHSYLIWLLPDSCEPEIYQLPSRRQARFHRASFPENMLFRYQVPGWYWAPGETRMNQSQRPEAGQTEEGGMISLWGKGLGVAVGVWEGGLRHLGGPVEEGLSGVRRDICQAVGGDVARTVQQRGTAGER